MKMVISACLLYLAHKLFLFLTAVPFFPAALLRLRHELPCEDKLTLARFQQADVSSGGAGRLRSIWRFLVEVSSVCHGGEFSLCWSSSGRMCVWLCRVYVQSADRFNKVLNGIALLPSLTESRPPFVLSSLPYAETIPSSSSRRNEPFSLSSPSSRSSSSSEKPSLPATLVLTGKQWRELHEVELVELQTPRPLRTYSEVQKLFPGFFQREGVARPPR